MRTIQLAALAFCLAASVAAKPLITSSEETLARICLAAKESPDRLIEACQAALQVPGLTNKQSAELHVGLGDALLWSDLDAEASESYRAALDFDPADVDAWNGLGWALRSTDGDSAALEAFEHSLSIDVSVQGLGGKAATARELGLIDGDASRKLLKASLAIDPEYIWALREIAWSHFDEANYAEAVRSFEAALAITATDKNSPYGLGRSALKSGDGLRALQAFNAVIEHSPDHFYSRVYRIIALRGLDRNAQALRDAERLIADHPDRSSGYIEKGLSLMALERRAEAIETYRRAEEVVGPNNAVLYWHADALTDDGRMEEALATIDRGISLEGADHSDYLLKSYIAIEMENYALARQAAEASLDTGVDDPWAHYYIAIAMVHAGKADEGIERFDTAIMRGLPDDRVGAFARELIAAGKFIEAMQLRIKY
ncbi:MAG: tetratricopeptide repeat protein [Boseongicola sp.]